MTISYKDTTSTAGASSTTSITVAKPTGAARGDSLFAVLFREASTETITPPAGWVLLDRVQADTNHDASLWYRVIDGEGWEEGTYEWQWTTSCFRSCSIACYSGTPWNISIFDVTLTSNSGNGATITATGLTKVDTDGLIFLACPWDWTGSATPPAGYTERLDGDGAYIADDLTLAAQNTGATGDISITYSVADSWVAWLVALVDDAADDHDISIGSSSSLTVAYKGVHGPFWVDEDTAYVLYVGGTWTAKKTTDRGLTWSVPISTNSPNTAGGYEYGDAVLDLAADRIHVITEVSNVGSNPSFGYTYFDLTTDEWHDWGTHPDDIPRIHTGGSPTAAEHNVSVCAVPGRIYAIYRDVDNAVGSGANSLFLKSDNGGVTWDSLTSPTNDDLTYFELYPAIHTGDTDDIWALSQNNTTDDLYVWTYDASAGTWSARAVHTAIQDSTPHPFNQINAAVRQSDGHLIVTAFTAFDNVAVDLMVWDITDIATSVATLTNVITNSDDVAYPRIGINPNNDDLHIVMTGEPGGAQALHTNADVYRYVSEDGGTTWLGPYRVNHNYDDHRHTSYAQNPYWFMPFWFEDDLNDIWISPSTSVQFFEEAVPVSLDVTSTAAISQSVLEEVDSDAALAQIVDEEVGSSASILAPAIEVSSEVDSTAAVAQEVEEEVGSSAAIAVVEASEVDSAAALAQVEDAEILTSAAISQSVQEEVDSEAAVSQAGEAEVDADASVSQAVSEDVGSSASIILVVESEVGSEASVAQTVDADILSSAALSVVVVEEVGTEGSISQAVALEVSSSSSVVIIGIEEISSDAAITGESSASVSTTAAAAREEAGDVDTIASLSQLLEDSVDSDAHLSLQESEDVQSDVALSIVGSSSVQSDASFSGVSAVSVSGSAAVEVVALVQITTSAALSKREIEEVGSDAAVTRTENESVSTDASLTSPVEDVDSEAAVAQSASASVTSAASASQSAQSEVSSELAVSVDHISDLDSSVAISTALSVEVTGGAAVTLLVESEVETEARISSGIAAGVETSAALGLRQSAAVGTSLVVTLRGVEEVGSAATLTVVAQAEVVAAAAIAAFKETEVSSEAAISAITDKREDVASSAAIDPSALFVQGIRLSEGSYQREVRLASGSYQEAVRLAVGSFTSSVRLNAGSY